MKKIIYIVFVIVILSGCYDGDISQVEEQVDNIIIEDEEYNNTIIIDGHVICFYYEGEYMKNSANITEYMSNEYTVVQDDVVYENQLPNSTFYCNNYEEDLMLSFVLDGKDTLYGHSYFALERYEMALDFSYSLDFNNYSSIVEEYIREKEIYNSPIIVDSILSIDLDNDGIEEQIVHASNFHASQEAKEYYKLESELTLVSEVELLETENIGVYDLLFLVDETDVFIIYDDFDKLGYYEVNDFSNMEKSDVFKTYPELFIFEKNSYNWINLYDIHGEIRSYSLNIAITDDYEFEIEGGEEIVFIADIDNDGFLEIVTKNIAAGYSERSYYYNIYRFNEQELELVFHHELPY